VRLEQSRSLFAQSAKWEMSWLTPGRLISKRMMAPRAAIIALCEKQNNARLAEIKDFNAFSDMQCSNYLFRRSRNVAMGLGPVATMRLSNHERADQRRALSDLKHNPLQKV